MTLIHMAGQVGLVAFQVGLSSRMLECPHSTEVVSTVKHPQRQSAWWRLYHLFRSSLENHGGISACFIIRGSHKAGPGSRGEDVHPSLLSAFGIKEWGSAIILGKHNRSLCCCPEFSPATHIQGSSLCLFAWHSLHVALALG